MDAQTQEREKEYAARCHTVEAENARLRDQLRAALAERDRFAARALLAEETIEEMSKRPTATLYIGGKPDGALLVGGKPESDKPPKK